MLRLIAILIRIFIFVELNSPVLSDEHLNSSENNSLHDAVLDNLNQIHPITTPQSQCDLRPFHWANFSSAHMIHLSGMGVDHLFRTRPAVRRVSLPKKPCVSSTCVNNLYTNTKPNLVQCSILYIHSPDCPYSMAAFPYVRALARAYPQLFLYAVEVDDYTTYRWSLRIMFVPKLKVLVDGRIVREYAGSDTDLSAMIDFVWQTTHQLPKGPIGLSPRDFSSSNAYIPPAGPNMALIGSWCVTIFCIFYAGCLFHSSIQRFVNKVVYRVSGGRFGCPLPTSVVASTLSTLDTD